MVTSKNTRKTRKANQSPEQRSEFEKNQRRHAERLLKNVATRLMDVGCIGDQLDAQKLDELGEEAAGRMLQLTAIRASQELQEAGRLLGVKKFEAPFATYADEL